MTPGNQSKSVLAHPELERMPKKCRKWHASSKMVGTFHEKQVSERYGPVQACEIQWYRWKWNDFFELSKTVKNGLGEAVGINFISSNDIGAFINRLEECELQDYFEKGLEMAIEKDGIKVQAVDISKHACMEIDFLDDLNTANETFHS